jgi:putative addiction module killer protein
MIIKKYEIREYVTSEGKNPFRSWIVTLNPTVRARIQARVFRIEEGSLGDYKSVGHGVCEIRLAFGPGFRIYFGFDGQRVVILLAGGEGSQRRDITKARRYWLDYLGRKNHDTPKR